ncbi:MAG: CopD family protein [Halieaceae bacterium]|jgi:putative membrane protein|nr:CopD family protein [Halieaceae bacterium]
MLWIRALHIIFVVCWFAGLFYLPRIFVYYAASEHAQTRAQLAIMSRRLYRFVTPFMYLTAVFGVWLIAVNPDYYLQAKWLWLKLAGVVFLIVYHFQCGRYVKRINENSDDHSHVFYRFFNEVPVLFLFAIVFLVVLKPF